MEMFNYMIQADNAQRVMDRTADRIMAAQYNQEVQRGDYPRASQTAMRIFGQWLQNRQ